MKRREPGFVVAVQPRRDAAALDATFVQRRGATRLASVVMACALVAAVGAVAQSEPSLDELLGLDPTPAVTGDANTDAAADVRSAAEEVAGVLQGPALSESFEFAVAEMMQVAVQLEATEVGLPTQRLQQRILDRLDQLVAAASSSPPPSSSGSGQGQPQPRDGDNQQNRPGQGQAGQPGDANQPGQGEQAMQPGGSAPSGGGFSPGSAQDPGAAEKSLDEMRSEWGALPPRLRDALSDGLDEPYSPVYRDATEAYYRRLAEEAGR